MNPKCHKCDEELEYNDLTGQMECPECGCTEEMLVIDYALFGELVEA